MVTSIGAETAKLAGLHVDLGQKLRNSQITLEQFEWWLNQATEVRDRFMGEDFRAVIKGTSQIVVVKHIVDLDADPYIPEGWEVAEHKKAGQFEWSPNKVRLYLSENQKDGKWIKGEKLQPEVAAQSPFNANLLDFLLAHPELIPEEWKGKAMFFWNTVYRSADGRLCVRCLSWGGDCWYWSCGWLGDAFDSSSPAACSQVSSN